MRDFILQFAYFGFLLTILAFQLGLFLKRKFKLSIFNAPFVSIVVTIAVLLIFDIDYETYNQSAKYLTYFLTPATVCLAIPLYHQIALLKKHIFAIIVSITCGVLASLLSIFLLSLAFGLNHDLYVTLLPKSITTPIGMKMSEMNGGIVTLTIVSICITGVLGNTFAETACRIFRLTDPVARGLAIGTASHASGTTRAMSMGEIEGAMSSLSIVVAGIITVLILSFFVNLI